MLQFPDDEELSDPEFAEPFVRSKLEVDVINYFVFNKFVKLNLEQHYIEQVEIEP